MLASACGHYSYWFGEVPLRFIVLLTHAWCKTLDFEVFFVALKELLVHQTPNTVGACIIYTTLGKHFEFDCHNSILKSAPVVIPTSF
jgi:hypothetical protein